MERTCDQRGAHGALGMQLVQSQREIIPWRRLIVPNSIYLMFTGMKFDKMPISSWQHPTKKFRYDGAESFEHLISVTITRMRYDMMAVCSWDNPRKKFCYGGDTLSQTPKSVTIMRMRFDKMAGYRSYNPNKKF